MVVDAALRAAVHLRVALPAVKLRGEPVSNMPKQDAKVEKLPGALKKEVHRKMMKADNVAPRAKAERKNQEKTRP